MQCDLHQEPQEQAAQAFENYHSENFFLTQPSAGDSLRGCPNKSKQGISSGSLDAESAPTLPARSA